MFQSRSARQWAILAHREDLLEKKIENITKYYICSDHFDQLAFLNPDVEDKAWLKLNKTYSIPLPSIFEDNLMANVKCVSENKEKFVNYTKHVVPSIKLECSPEIRQSKRDVHHKNQQVDDTNKDDEEHQEYIEEVLEISRADDDQEDSIDINAFCRLCARNLNNLVPLFSESGDFNIETECLKLMPPGLIAKDDGLPQYSCMECIDKLQSCATIIDSFVCNQNLFELE